jgi:NADH-quinone oxidoreductase subunit A
MRANGAMDRTYLPILLLVGFVVANAVMMIALSALTMRPRPNPDKLIPYESGIPPLGTGRERFSV